VVLVVSLLHGLVRVHTDAGGILVRIREVLEVHHSLRLINTYHLFQASRASS